MPIDIGNSDTDKLNTRKQELLEEISRHTSRFPKDSELLEWAKQNYPGIREYYEEIIRLEKELITTIIKLEASKKVER